MQRSDVCRCCGWRTAALDWAQRWPERGIDSFGVPKINELVQTHDTFYVVLTVYCAIGKILC